MGVIITKLFLKESYTSIERKYVYDLEQLIYFSLLFPLLENRFSQQYLVVVTTA